MSLNFYFNAEVCSLQSFVENMEIIHSIGGEICHFISIFFFRAAINQRKDLVIKLHQ